MREKILYYAVHEVQDSQAQNAVAISLTVLLFKINDVNQRLKRRHTAPAFHTIFHQVFGLVRNQHEFPSCRIDFNPRTYFVRPKTCYCQQ